MNYTRTVVENAGCCFFKINLQHDVGQDAFHRALVVDGRGPHARGRCKSSRARATFRPDTAIFGVGRTLSITGRVDLITLGVVYDPDEATACWLSLKAASLYHRQ